MKTHKHLFEKICSFKNLHSAYFKARKSKRYRSYVLKFNFNLEENLLDLQKNLLNLTYQPGPYCEFSICDSKKRLIKAPDFRDRVVHHALCNIIEPIFDKGFIYDSYACRRGKGTHLTIKRLEKFIKSLKVKSKENAINAKIYCLKCDISKYFGDINHRLLFGFIAKQIQDKKVLWLVKQIIESDSPGIPIGNLTSQLFANIYLNELDQFIKHHLRIKYYIRYMDDFLILSHDKNYLRSIKEQIRIFLRDYLKLELHPKKAEIFPIDKGVDFLGYIILDNHRRLRKSTVKRFIKRMKIYKKRIIKGKMNKRFFEFSLWSWFAYARFANSWKLRRCLEKKLDAHELL